jgi:hypothetical protein
LKETSPKLDPGILEAYAWQRSEDSWGLGRACSQAASEQTAFLKVSETRTQGILIIPKKDKESQDLQPTNAQSSILLAKL